VGRPHFTAGAPAWEAVADYALDWATRHVGALAETADLARPDARTRDPSH